MLKQLRLKEIINVQDFSKKKKEFFFLTFGTLNILFIETQNQEGFIRDESPTLNACTCHGTFC